MMYKGRSRLDFNVQAGILKSLAYYSVFSFPVKKRELFNFLVVKNPVGEKDFEENLDGLVREGVVEIDKGLYFLKDMRGRLVDRGERYKLAVKKLGLAGNITNILKLIPFIKLISVTGSVAVYNCKKEDDIDVLIVASSGRVWTVRFLVVVILKILGRYFNAKDPANKICPNIYLDERGLKWGGKNIFVAHEILSMKPILNRDSTYERLVFENRWVFNYLGNNNLRSKPCKFEDVGMEVRKQGILERILKFVQKKYMQRRVTTEELGDFVIHLKKNDNSKWILKGYECALKGLDEIGWQLYT